MARAVAGFAENSPDGVIYRVATPFDMWSITFRLHSTLSHHSRASNRS